VARWRQGSWRHGESPEWSFGVENEPVGSIDVSALRVEPPRGPPLAFMNIRPAVVHAYIEFKESCRCLDIPGSSSSSRFSSSLSSSFGITTRPRNPGSIPGTATDFYPQYPDRIWGSSNLLSNGSQGFFPRR
jgi:hypothetical protein